MDELNQPPRETGPNGLGLRAKLRKCPPEVLRQAAASFLVELPTKKSIGEPSGRRAFRRPPPAKAGTGSLTKSKASAAAGLAIHPGCPGHAIWRPGPPPFMAEGVQSGRK